MQRTFGPMVVHPDGTETFTAKCYCRGCDCTFRIGDTCTHVKPSRKIETLPHTPDWRKMKAGALDDAREMARAAGKVTR